MRLPFFRLSIAVVYSFVVLSCSTSSVKSGGSIRTEVEKQTPYNASIGKIDEKEILKKIEQFEAVLKKNGKRLTIADWKLHDELLNKYIQLKSQSIQGTQINLPPHSRLKVDLPSFCLDSGRAVPADNEAFQWVKKDPSISYYKEILRLSSGNEIKQADAQTLLWNLQNKTRWETYPDDLKAILQKIDPSASIRLPSKFKDTIKDSAIDILKDHVPFSDQVENAVSLVEGEYYKYEDYARSIRDLTSKYPLEKTEGLSSVPQTSMYSSIRPQGYSSQSITFYNPSNKIQQIDLADYYLQPTRQDVQRIALAGDPARGHLDLLSRLEKALYGSMARLGIGFTPVLGDVADLYELVYGKDFVTAKPLSFDERLVSGVGVVLGSGSAYRYAKRWVNAPTEYLPRFEAELSQIAKRSQESADLIGARNVLNEGRAEADALGKSLDYTGTQELSKFLRDGKVLREDRVRTIQSFESGTIGKHVVQEDQTVYRWHNGDGEVRQFGRFVSPEKLENGALARRELALPNENKMRHLDSFTLKKGHSIFEGKVGPNLGQPGGGRQILIPGDVQKSLKFLERIK
jgi:hypothetical protein